MEWAIEHALTYGKPVAATMCIGPTGDHEGVAAGECAVRSILPPLPLAARPDAKLEYY